MAILDRLFFTLVPPYHTRCTMPQLKILLWFFFGADTPPVVTHHLHLHSHNSPPHLPPRIHLPTPKQANPHLPSIQHSIIPTILENFVIKSRHTVTATSFSAPVLPSVGDPIFYPSCQYYIFPSPYLITYVSMTFQSPLVFPWPLPTSYVNYTMSLTSWHVRNPPSFMSNWPSIPTSATLLPYCSPSSPFYPTSGLAPLAL